MDKEKQYSQTEIRISNLLDILGASIVNPMIQDPEKWSTTDMFNDPRFFEIENALQQIKMKIQTIYNQEFLGELSKDEAKIKTAALIEEENNLSILDNYPIWKAYNELQGLRTDILFKKSR